ncbi:MAG: ribosome maturation factor RimP [Acutalibacteraceae bacterium]|nr:ribosome maturation factor RimP [Oscillospiraceae bacterium]
MAKGKGGSTVAAVRQLVEPYAKELGLTIWDIRFEKEGASWYLRIFIDKEGGVGIDDCVDFSHAIDKPLDEADPIEQSYCLEVSSPGVERELSRPEHFEKCLGQSVLIRLIRPIDGQRDFTGTLESFDDGNITVRLENGSGFTFTKKEAAWVKLNDFAE